MPSELSIAKAAQIWCRPECAHIVMDTTLGTSFAEVLDEIWSKPWLGNATTKELLDEISTRIEIHGPGLSYKTVGGEEIASRWPGTAVDGEGKPDGNV